MTMKKIAAALFVLLTTSIWMGGHAEVQAEIAKKYVQGLQKIITLQKKIKAIHPFLKKLYPVVVVEGDDFLIYDYNSKKKQYVFIKAAQPAMIVPEGVRAAFPLEFYDNKMACVVTGDAFDDLIGYATIFHEFIHCAQMECCELKLKSRLKVAREAMAKQDFMWELNHPFPYEDNVFAEAYTIFFGAASKKDLEGISRCRTYLKEMLNVPDYEYMVWQEWKEGFARLIENKIRKKFDLQENHGGTDQPYSRVTFYEGGSLYIEALFGKDKTLEKDVERLFDIMLSGYRL
jgi:hypothetical protein